MHLLFLACIPLTILLLVVHAWVPAVVVFFVGIPVFWSLRNRTAVRTMEAPTMDVPTTRLGGLPHTEPRYTIPNVVLGRLDDESFEDLPLAMRRRFSISTSFGDVVDSVAGWGMLPPGTSWGVVYRACFLPYMEDGEDPLFITFGMVSTAVRSALGEFNMPKPEATWFLVTDRAIRWHQVKDRIPGMPARSPVEDMLAGLRYAYFGPGPIQINVGEPSAPLDGVSDREVTVEQTLDQGAWRHIFEIADDPANQEMFKSLRRHAQT